MTNTGWPDQSASSAIIELEDVHFAYGQTEVLKGIDLSVQRGEIVVMLGPNGAGKTTLVENILGSLTPHRGSVRVLGENPKQASAEFWCQVGLVQQHWSDHPKWRVKDQLEWLRSSYESVGRRARSGDEVLKEVSLFDKRNTTLGKLSGGQRRRIDFACALLASPSLLILDEPTTGLDPQAKAEIHDLLTMIVDQGNTIVLTTHDLNEAEKLASRVLILLDGTFVASGSPRQLQANLAGKAQVTWYQDGVEHVHATSAPEAFLLTLDLHSITGLTVTRPTLEDAYLAMVKRHAEGFVPVDDQNRASRVIRVGQDRAERREMNFGQTDSSQRKFLGSSDSSVLGTAEVDR